MASRYYVFSRDFSRRLNDDGSAQSVCLHCFATLDPVHHGEQLEELESAHICLRRRPASLNRNSLPMN